MDIAPLQLHSCMNEPQGSKENKRDPSPSRVTAGAVCPGQYSSIHLALAEARRSECRRCRRPCGAKVHVLVREHAALGAAQPRPFNGARRRAHDDAGGSHRAGRSFHATTGRHKGIISTPPSQLIAPPFTTFSCAQCS
jgi:hypothetical protein